MSIKGSPYARFRRALETGNALLARTAAAELAYIGLEDALGLVIVFAHDDFDRFGRAAVRWQARLCLEHAGISLEEAQLVLSSLAALRSPAALAGAAGLAVICERHSLPRAAERLRRL